MKRIVHMKTEGELMNYEVYTPDTQEKNLPMIVFLHGAGERGWNIDHLAKHGIPMMMKNGAEIPAVVLCPQCPANCVWDNIPFDVMALIEKIAAEYEVDSDRISITGGSMGGFGTWYTAMAYPDMFAALAPCCGGGMAWGANVLKMPIWTFHGLEDKVVSPNHTLEMIEKLKSTNPRFKYDLYEGVGHNSWELAFSEELLEWMLSQSKDC